jgi:cytochrome c oxidase cbb3-type subunit 3
MLRARPVRLLTLACGIATVALVFAQGQGNPGGGAGAFPGRPPADPASIERGKRAYSTNCAYCHGDDARGGNGGPNLLRSEYMMKDREGEVLRQFLLNKSETTHSGVREGVLKFGFSNEQTADISAYIHDFPLSSRDQGRMRPPTIVVGDSKAGEVYFNSHCASCHSAAGDLKGIATRIDDPRMLQQRWLMPRIYGGRGGVAGFPGVTVTVTQPDGEKIEGKLGRLDDFVVTLTDSTGAVHTFQRDHDRPKIEVHDPMQSHKNLLPLYTDKDIHDVTAWLVTLK